MHSSTPIFHFLARGLCPRIAYSSSIATQAQWCGRVVSRENGDGKLFFMENRS
jgi:hypothetical protein